MKSAKKIVSLKAFLVVCPIVLFSVTIAATQFDGWKVVTPITACTARHETTAVTVKDVLYLIGGRGIKPVEAYNAKENTWTRMKSEPPMELHHFSAIAVEDKIAILGALTGGFPKEKPVPHLWWYETKNDQWVQGVEIPEDRRRGTAGSVLHGDKLYLVCGNTNGHWNGFVPWLDSFDLKTGKWTRLADAPHARDHFQAAVVDGKIYASGGRHSHAEIKKVFDKTVAEVDVYDISKNQWTTLSSPIPTPRAGAPTVVRDGRVIVIGGESGVSAKAHGEVEALEVSTGKWESLPPMGEPRHSGGADFLEGDLYYVAGNAGRGGGNEKNTIEKLVWPKNSQQQTTK